MLDPWVGYRASGMAVLPLGLVMQVKEASVALHFTGTELQAAICLMC